MPSIPAFSHRTIWRGQLRNGAFWSRVSAFMKLRRLHPLFLLATVLGVGCRSPICPWCGHDIRERPPAGAAAVYLPAGAVQGMATSLERGELHPMAVLTVSLHDVTLHAGEAPKLIAETVVEHPQTFPVAFQIDYPADTIDESHQYLVSAKMTVESSILFETDTKYPVLTHGAPNRVQLVLARKKQP